MIKNKNITSINLSYNNLGKGKKEIFMILGEALIKMKNLLEIDLSSNILEKNESKKIKKILEYLKNLKKINV